jgi:biotin transport system permease protein
MTPGFKLAGLAEVAAVLSLAPGFVPVAAVGAVVTVLWHGSKLSWRALGRALRPLMWFLIPIALFQGWALGLGPALRMASSIVVLVAAAEWVSRTTRNTDLLAAVTHVVRPLAPLGVAPDAVSFAVVFLIRLVPTIAAFGREVHEARLARGAGCNPLALLSPLLIRLLRHADLIAEALAARGFNK